MKVFRQQIGSCVNSNGNYENEAIAVS